MPVEQLVVAHVIIGLEVGGAERMLQRLISSGQADDGVRHHVFSLSGLGRIGQELRSIGIVVEPLGLTGLITGAPTVLRLARRIRALRPHVVQCWMYHGDLIGGLAAKVAGCKAVIWNVRATALGEDHGVSRATKYLRRICAFLSRTMPYRIVYVANSARRFHEALGYDAGKGLVLPNGYDLPLLMGKADRASIRAELSVRPNEILIGSVGRFSGLKDYATFIAAASGLAATHPTAQFVLAGTGLEPENSELVSWIEKGGSQERFRLLGPMDDVRPVYAGMDIFCLHSIAEGFPNVVAEAMASAIPCVVTDVGDAAELVGATGIVVPPGSPAELARGLSEMIGLGSQRRAQLGLRARERIAENFSLASVRGRYEHLYTEIARISRAS